MGAKEENWGKRIEWGAKEECGSKKRERGKRSGGFNRSAIEIRNEFTNKKTRKIGKSILI